MRWGRLVSIEARSSPKRQRQHKFPRNAGAFTTTSRTTGAKRMMRSVSCSARIEAEAAQSVSCSARIEASRKKVRFCEVIEARLVLQAYPADFFYTCSDFDRFRIEARGEGIQEWYDASSSATKAMLFALSLVATMVAFFPMLLLLKVASIFRTKDELVVRPEAGSLAESSCAGLPGLSAFFGATEGGVEIEKRHAIRVV